MDSMGWSLLPRNLTTLINTLLANCILTFISPHIRTILEWISPLSSQHMRMCVVTSGYHNYFPSLKVQQHDAMLPIFTRLYYADDTKPYLSNKIYGYHTFSIKI